jgi:hypothetical protein
MCWSWCRLADVLHSNAVQVCMITCLFGLHDRHCIHSIGSQHTTGNTLTLAHAGTTQQPLPNTYDHASIHTRMCTIWQQRLLPHSPPGCQL